MLTQVAPTFTVSTLPEKTLYWAGFDTYYECSLTGDYLSTGELAAMLPEEKRGYEYAQRCAADTETYVYLSNRNSFGDLTEW